MPVRSYNGCSLKNTLTLRQYIACAGARYRGIVSTLLSLLVLLVCPCLPGTAQTPTIRFQVGGHSGTITSVSTSTDGQYLTSSSKDGTVKLWLAADNSLVRTFVTASQANCAALSPDGTLLAAGDASGRLWLWRTANAQLVRVVSVFISGNHMSHSVNDLSGIFSLAYSPDGSSIAVAGQFAGPINAIKIYSAATGRTLRTLYGHSDTIYQLAYAHSKPNMLVSGAEDATVRIWNTATGASTIINAFKTGNEFPVAVSNDGALVVAAGTDDVPAVKVWDVTGATPKLITSVTANMASGPTAFTQPITALAISSDKSQIGVGSGENSQTNKLISFALPSGNGLNFYGILDTGMTSLAFTPDGNSLISGELGWSVRRWDVGTNNGTAITQLYGPVYGTAVSGDGSAVALAYTPGFKGWTPSKWLPNNLSAGGPAYYNGTGTWTSGNAVDLRSGSDGSWLQTLPGGTAPMSFSSDGTLFAYGSLSDNSCPDSDYAYYSFGKGKGDTVNVNDMTAGGTNILTFPAAINDLWFGPDSQTFMLYGVFQNINANYTVLNGWHMTDGSTLTSFTSPFSSTTPVITYAASADGGYEAIFDGSVIYLYTLPDLTLVQQIVPLEYIPGYRIALSLNGAYLAYTFNDGVAIRIVRMSDGRKVATINGTSGIVRMMFAPQGDALAVFRSSGTFSLYDLTGRSLGSWTDQLGTGVASVAFSPGGDSILLGRYDGAAIYCYRMTNSISSLTLDLSAAAGGKDTRTGTVTLNALAPASGLQVLLSSSNPAVASVPSSIVIPAGTRSATFAVTTSAVTAPTAVALTAIYRNSSQSANLTVTPVIAPKAITLLSSAVQGGLWTSGVVSLKAPAYPGGALVTLTSSAPGAANVPVSVLVPAGKTSAGFLIATNAVAADTPVTLTATIGGSAVSTTLLVQQATISAFAIMPTPVQGGVETAQGHVFLAAPCTSSVTINIKVTTTATAGVVSFPATLVIPANSQIGFFDIVTKKVTANTVVTFQVSAGSTTSGPVSSLTVTP